MAEIKPFRAWRYNQTLSNKIDQLISPLFDVVTPQRLLELYQSPLNSIHLSVPNGTPQQAGETLKEWKSNGTLVMDELPGIYVYYQYYQSPVDGTAKCRKGFVCNIKVHEWSDRIILHHENTIPGSVSDRLSILTETGFHASATHGLYSDPEQQLERYMDESISHPIYDVESEGIREVVGVIHDYQVIRRFIQLIENKQIILADGHHRFEASIQHARHRRLQGDLTPEYHLMYLSNVESSDLTILPTHRIINSSGIELDHLLKSLKEDFNVTHVKSMNEGEALIHNNPANFVMISKTGCIHLKLKEGKAKDNPWPFPQDILDLDLTILHYFIIEKAIGIPGPEQRKSGKIRFERNASTCEQWIKNGEAELAFLTRPVSIHQIMSVCESGYTLPQKSTWFYPKLNSGYFFCSILPGEGRLPEYVQF